MLKRPAEAWGDGGGGRIQDGGEVSQIPLLLKEPTGCFWGPFLKKKTKKSKALCNNEGIITLYVKLRFCCLYSKT